MAAGDGWLGALTATGVTVATPAPVGASVVVACQPGTTLSAPTRTVATVVDSTGAVKVPVTGLTPGTVYAYTVEIDGVPCAWTGRFRTLPAVGAPANFRFGVGSCQRTGSNALVFDAIAARQLDFFMHSGDWHYDNITTNDPALFRASVFNQLALSKIGGCFRSTPIVYVFDDHDYGPDNSDRTSPSHDASVTAYRQVVPHYPLGTGSPLGAVFQAFTAGRVRFLFLDERSARDPDADNDTPAKTILGVEQKAWLKQELLAARPTGHAYTVINSPNVWLTDSNGGDTDSWGKYRYERREIADFIAANNLSTGLAMVEGDSHLLAMDDGRHNDYSTAGGARFPIITGGPINQSTSTPGKGGPYLYGKFLGENQYVVADVVDDGTTVTITWTGWSVDATTGVETQLCQMVTSNTPVTPTVATGETPMAVSYWDGEATRVLRLRRRTATDYDDVSLYQRT